MADPKELASEVIQVLTMVHQELKGQPVGDGAWTNAVKTKLCRLGKEKHKYTVCASGVDNGICQPDYGEWLYDVCWLRYSDEKNAYLLSDVVLVAESEWGNDQEVIHDFQKLMLARADLRVMIYADKNSSADSTRKKIESEIESFARSQGGKGDSTDSYLLAAWESEEGGFKFFEMTGDEE